jgi:hypothetical protein
LPDTEFLQQAVERGALPDDDNQQSATLSRRAVVLGGGPLDPLGWVLHPNRREAFPDYRFDFAAAASVILLARVLRLVPEFVKPIMQGTGVAVALQRGSRSTLLAVLEALLRALHPLMPFITRMAARGAAGAKRPHNGEHHGGAVAWPAPLRRMPQRAEMDG